MQQIVKTNWVLTGAGSPQSYFGRPKGVGDGQTVDIPLPLADDSVPGVCGVS
jgi:hypothetical protein